MLIPHTLMHAEAKPCIARANSSQKYPCPTAKTDLKFTINGNRHSDVVMYL